MNANSIVPDTPIVDFEQDRLDRGNFARALGRVIASYDHAGNLVIGLYGEWGIGKTSLLNLALGSLAHLDPAPIVVHFNPWQFADRENLLRQFFTSLSSAIQYQGRSKNYDRIGKLLKTLSKGIDSLSDVPGPGPFAKPIGWILRRFGKHYEDLAEKALDLDALKSEISAALVQGRRRVIVVMDDLDRLSAEEIRVIFQAVKALADFQYTTYILAFDDQVVGRALSEVQNIEGARYLEKIVNAPVHVPPISRFKMQELVLSALNTFAEEHPNYDWADTDRAAEIIAFLCDHCRTVRHLRRLANALFVDIQAIDGEVDGYDFIGITALRAFLPRIYEFVRDNRDIFLETAEVIIMREQRDAEARAILAQLVSDNHLRESSIGLLRSMFPRLRQIQGGTLE